MQINYGFPGVAKIATAGANITTSEAAIMTITDGGFLRQSQLTCYFKVTLGSATSVKFRYYYSPNGGTDYFQVPVKNDSSGLLADIPSVIDSTSPTRAVRTLTGSIDPAASTAVVGVGTLFLTELVVGDVITVSAESRTVTAIADNTNLTVGSAFSNNGNDTSPDIAASIGVVEDIPYSGSGAFKVTAQAVGATAVLNAGYIYVRDN